MQSICNTGKIIELKLATLIHIHEVHLTSQARQIEKQVVETRHSFLFARVYMLTNEL